MPPREDNITKPRRLDVWGNSLLNKLSARSRKKRKRAADKKRRALLKRPNQTPPQNNPRPF